MMNKLTRRISKIPEEVWDQIGPSFLDAPPLPTMEDDGRKLTRFDESATDFVRTGITVSKINFCISPY